MTFARVPWWWLWPPWENRHASLKGRALTGNEQGQPNHRIGSVITLKSLGERLQITVSRTVEQSLLRVSGVTTAVVVIDEDRYAG